MKLLGLLSLSIGVLAATLAHAEVVSTGAQEYERITPQQATEAPDQVEVVEVFWYGCPHCYDFEPHLRKWLESKPDGVLFRRMPGIFSEKWIPHARAYYAAEILGVLDEIHRALFVAEHEDKRPLRDEASLTEFFSEHGVAAEQFREAYNSFTVDSKVRQAIKSSRDYGITGVPSMIVNGKYRSSARLTGSYENLLKVVDHLVDMEKTR